MSLARLCGVGLWHGLLEYSVGSRLKLDGVPVDDFMYPCNSLSQYSSHCYAQLFTFLGRGDWRFKGIQKRSQVRSRCRRPYARRCRRP